MAKHKPVLGLDLDGVVVDFNAMWIRAWYEEFGDLHSVEDITEWDYRKDNVDMSSSEFWAWVRSVRLWEPGRTLVHEDNYMVALELHRKWDIHVVTSKPRWAMADTADWLDYSGIKYESLSFTREKTRVVCDAYVDDSPSNLEKYVAGPMVPYAPMPLVYRQIRPWNRHVPGTVAIEDLSDLL